MSFMDLVREPLLRVRLQSQVTIGKSDDGASHVVRGPLGTSPIGPFRPEYDAPDARLAAGAPLGELRDDVLRAGGVDAASSYLLRLQHLTRWNLIEYVLADENGEQAVILPQWENFVPSLAAAPPETTLDRFALLRRADDSWLLESPLVGARFAFSDLAALTSPLVRRALAGTGFLADAAGKANEAGKTTGTNGANAAAEARRTALAQWEFHDLLLHKHSRFGWHRDAFGAQFPYIGEIEPPPAKRPPWPGPRIALARAPDDAAGEAFASVLERRRSERQYDEDHPITLRQLGALLDRAARPRSYSEIPVQNFRGRKTNFEISWRPYPNGGASYELEIYPAVDRCADLESGLYHYDAAAHALVRIAERTPDVERLLAFAKVATAGLAEPQIVLAIAARFSRVMWKYRSICYATILRNTGALYQTLYLAATELGLAPCGLGSGNSALFAQLTGLDPVVEGTVGEFILGGRPRKLEQSFR